MGENAYNIYMRKKKKKLLFLSYGDVLYDNGYKTRMLGELSLVSQYKDFEKFFVSFEKNDSFNKNKKNLALLIDKLNRQNIRPTIISRQNRWYFDFYRDINKFREILIDNDFGNGIIHAQSLFACTMACWLKKEFGYKVIFDMHGLVGPELETLNSFFLKRWLSLWAENYCLRNSDFIFTASEALKKYLAKEKKLGVQDMETQNIASLPCLVDKNNFSEIKTKTQNEWRKKLGLPQHRFVAAYVHGGQPWQQLPYLEEMEQNNIFLLIITTCVSSWQKKLVDYGLNNYKIISVPHAKIGQYLAAADCGLLFREKNLLNRIAFPTKMAEYLICGLPVWHNGTIDDVNEIIKNDLGLNLDSCKNIEQEIGKWIKNYETNRLKTKNYCQKFAYNNLLWESRQEELKNIYEKLSQKKILFTLTTDIWGGAQKYVFDLAKMVNDRKGEALVVFGQQDPDKKLINMLSEEIINYQITKYSQRSINPLLDLLALWETFWMIKKNKIDIVHANSSKSGIVARLAAKFAGVKKIYYTAHGWVFAENIFWLIKWFYIFLERLAGNWSNRIFCVSKCDYLLAKKYRIIETSKLKLIHNAIDDQEIIKLANINERNKKIINIGKQIQHWKNSGLNVLGVTANFFPPKNVTGIIDILNILIKQKKIKVRLVLVGDGPQKKLILRAINKFDLKKYVLMTGKLTNPYPIMKQFDILVLPSTKEGFPYVLLEAGVLKLPVITYDVGGTREIVINNENGLLIPAKDKEKMTEAIEKLINNKKLAKEFGINLNQRVVEKFSMEKMRERYWEEYTD